MKDQAIRKRKSSVQERCNRLKIASFKRLRDAALGDLDLTEAQVAANYFIIRIAEDQAGDVESVAS